ERDKGSLRAERGRDGGAEQPHPLEQRADGGHRQVPPRHVVTARHDEHVSLEQGPRIEERHELVVFQHQVGWHLAGDYPAEPTVSAQGCTLRGRGARKGTASWTAPGSYIKLY